MNNQIDIIFDLKKEIFLPAWQRDQEKNELQHELERKFERIYADSSESSQFSD